jgi:hypothetical protein
LTTVYNLRVADFHTYFVGSSLWGFDVWVHNANYIAPSSTAMRAEGVGNQRIVVHSDGSIEIPRLFKNKRKGIEEDLNIGFDNFERGIQFAEKGWARGHLENNVKMFKVKEQFLDYLKRTAILESDVAKTPGGHLLPQIVDLPYANQYRLKSPQIEMLRKSIIQGTGIDKTIIRPST